MKVDFYSSTIGIGSMSTLQISIRLAPRASVRFWWRPIFESERNRVGSHGLVIPFEDGWNP